MTGVVSSISDTKLRSIIKGMIWRILASLTTIILVFLFTRDIEKATCVGGMEVIVKLLLYYGHERIWNVISWGRISVNE